MLGHSTSRLDSETDGRARPHIFSLETTGTVHDALYGQSRSNRHRKEPRTTCQNEAHRYPVPLCQRKGWRRLHQTGLPADDKNAGRHTYEAIAEGEAPAAS